MKKIMIVLLLASAGVASDPRFKVIGLGNIKCSIFNKTAEKDREPYYQWVFGAVSIYEFPPKPSEDQIIKSMEAFCKELPNSDISLAAFAMKNINLLDDN